MPPIILHQAKEYSQYLHYNFPLDCIVHQKPPGYMDRYGWIKSMNQLSNLWGASPIKNQILFFDVHESHFEYVTLIHMMCKNIQPFVLKEGKQINDQPNDNVPNTKVKPLYDV